MIVLRRATNEDSDFFLRLRNQPSVREKSFTSHEITPEEHGQWFSGAKDTLFVIEAHSERIGQIRISHDDVISVSILPDFRKKGYATEAILRAVSLFFSFPGKEALVADILEDNEPSKKIFGRVGFTYKESLTREGKKFSRYVYERKRFCEECGFLNPRPTATAVIIREGNILLVKRNEEPYKGWWDLPGGYVGWHELPEEALARELDEELHIAGKYAYIKAFRGTGEYKGKVHSVISHAFFVSFSGEITLNGENETYEWFPISRLPDIAFDSNKEIIDFVKNVWFDLDTVKSLVSQLDATASVNEWSLYRAVLEGHVERIYENGRLVGMGWIFLRQTMLRKQAVVEDMIVDASLRGKGYGRKILLGLIEWAKKEGVEVVELTTNPKRVAANELYKSEGFVLHETNHYLLRLQ